MTIFRTVLYKLLRRSSIWRDAMSWRAHSALTAAAVRPLLSLELAAYTKEQCLVAADDMPLPHTSVGEVAAILHARSGRGSDTLDAAVKIMRQSVANFIGEQSLGGV